MAGRVAAIVLAAGASTRMAPDNKLLLVGASGVTMVGSVVRACVASTAALVVVVTGHAAADVEQAALTGARGDRIVIVHAADHGLGQSASLRAGLAALPSAIDAALICLADMPLVTSEIINRLIVAHDAAAGRLIVAPTSGGRRGNPVLWNRRFFPAMAGMCGDVGARALLDAYAASVLLLEVEDDAVLRDFDTPEAVLGGF